MKQNNKINLPKRRTTRLTPSIKPGG